MSPSAEAAPRPPGAQGAALPERRRTPSEVRAKQPANLLDKPLSAPSQRGATQSGGHKPYPLEAPPPASAAASNPPRLWPARIQTLERGPTLELNMLRRGDRGPLLFIGLAMLVATLIGLIVKTPLGIAIGIRKPTEGAIEVRTVPPVAAAVRLDGIYRGRAPLRLEGVRSGDRMLALEADGYVTVARRVTVEGGNTASVNIALEAQPSAAPAP
jgi:hypothetical protein